MLAGFRGGARVHEDECPCTVGALRHALVEAGLTEQSALLIADQSGDGDAVGQEAEPSGVAIHLRTGANSGEYGSRYTEQM